MVSSTSPNRSLLDYSLVACFGLIILLLGILLFDPFDQTSVESSSTPSSLIAWDNKVKTNTAIDHQHEIDSAAAISKSEIDEVEKKIHDAKAILSEKQLEVEKIVDKVEDEIEKTDSANNEVETTTTTEEDKRHDKEVKEKVIEAVVEKELGLDKWCGQCKYANMPFTCATRVEWMMRRYKITEDEAKESTLEYCGGQSRRILFGSHSF